ncbi:MAG: alpha-N-arabinofuranosidase [Acidobacteriota bacterium]|nr:alpha-N-arabinofuranosidase [Acidobacteriota bacterium]
MEERAKADSVSRRRFLAGSLLAGASLPAASLAASGKPPAAGNSARILVDPRRTISTINHHIFGSFIEHLGRAVYGGIFEPGSRLADSDGFRTDVLKQIQTLGVPIIRYPGGNFVSSYHWLDGVGPKDKRPRVLDLAWNTIETNQVGVNEFITWCRAANTEPLMGTNFGTEEPEMTAALLEYCNVPGGTKWSDLRREHGYEKPHNVKYWCLGNEMDGPWQVGHMPATEYGIKARDAARQMRTIDPTVKLIACGSSTPSLPTYLEWDFQTLEQCYDMVDGISLHRYFGNSDETGGDTTKYLALNLAMDRQIEEIISVCDLVRGRKRTGKTLWLSFDEWNVWYRARGPKADDGHRQAAPHLLEEIYNLEDALLVGGLLNTLIRRSDRVRVACLAQLVNVIAPIMTNEDGLFLQTIYYPYSWALHYARGNALDLAVESPAYEVTFAEAPFRPPEGLSVPYLDAAGTLDAESKTASLFILNRDLEHSRELTIEWQAATPASVKTHQALTGSDLKAVNSFQDPKRVVPQPLERPEAGATMLLKLPARSYTVLQVSLA